MQEDRKVISLCGAAKMYRLYGSQFDRIKDALPLFPGRHHQEFWALRDISFDVRRGESLGIVGVNGSGKSTLLQLVCGLLRPTRGSVRVNGRISALLELGSGFNPLLTGRENIFLQGAMQGLSRRELDRRLDGIIEFADIGDFIDQPVKNYSSGMMIRLAFSVAIEVDPEILIVDEALAVGDVFFQAKCFRRFEALRSRGVTILLVSHQLETIKSLCDRAIFLDHGQIRCIGTPKEAVDAFQKFAGTHFAPAPPEEPEEEVPEVAVVEESGAGVADAPRPFGEPSGGPDGGAVPHGNGKARLTDFSVNGAQGCREIMVGSARPTSIRVRYAVKERIDAPMVGVRLDTLSGQQIYGNNTTFANFPLEPCAPGDVVCLEFTQTLYLNQGSYMLTLVMGEWMENGELQYVDRRVDLAHLLITDGPYPYAGLCNFEGTVRRCDSF